MAFIGTVRPWYHWIALEKDINRYRFCFFDFIFEYLKRLQTSELLHTKMNPTSFLLSSYWLSHFNLLKKNPPKGCTILVWIGPLRVVGFLETFYSRAVIQRKIVDSPAFLEHGSAEKIAVCTTQPVIPTSWIIRGILYEVAQNFEVFSNIQN
jgi:hypothetical protein